MKILIIDDSPVARFELKTILENIGFTEIYEAENGEEGLSTARRVKPDLITLDIIMPGAGGIDILKKIKSESPHIKVIMISALGKQNTLVECIKSGAENFIIKPFLTEQIQEVFRGFYSGK